MELTAITTTPLDHEALVRTLDSTGIGAVAVFLFLPARATEAVGEIGAEPVPDGAAAATAEAAVEPVRA